MIKIDQTKMEFATKLLVAKMYNIKIPECEICKKGTDGIPNCKPGECDLPIELKNDKYGKIKISISNLSNGKWNFPFDRSGDYDTNILFAFSENWENIERVYAVPKKDMEYFSMVPDDM